jgi:MOSC domain-containing protein YiiM
MSHVQIGLIRTVQVGTPRRYHGDDPTGGDERAWRTSFFRSPSPDRRWLFTTHLEGNAQADTKNHGKPNQALLIYAADHYPVWQRELGRPEIGPGGFGENFTVGGVSEASACIGDCYGVGEAIIQVTGPRYPCLKIARRWGIPSLTARVAETGRTGWYCRVLREGWVEPGLPLTLVDRPCPDVTVALVNDFGHGRNRDAAAAKELAACPLLEAWWQRLVVVRAMGKEW